MPSWVSQLGDLSSIIGFVVTCFLFYEARKIRLSFLRKARLPEVTFELEKTIPELSNRLKNWTSDNKPALETIAKIKALLENIKPKTNGEVKKQINVFLSKLRPSKYLIIILSTSNLSEDAVWDLYAELNTIVTSLDQLIKDSKWD